MKQLKNYLTKIVKHMSSKKHRCECPIFLETPRQINSMLTQDSFINLLYTPGKHRGNSYIYSGEIFGRPVFRLLKRRKVK